MYLSELNIVGFKSFAKKTNVLFRGGITGIVGPNGCGKSNIVDSIRWVMGEQKSGALRSEKMENVIFSGSASAKAVGMAEVSLKIENNKNILPVDYAEIVITRRLFRSGESHYLMNGKQCRLKDITDLFMDTGVGPGTYSVIELPQVERILNGKEDERRKIFEEAAGITKYKLRRKATFRKLEATEKDLIRVEDIISEVDKSVRSLKRQVDKARRFQNLSQELKNSEIKLASYQYAKILDELEPLETQMNLITDERECASSNLAQRDSDYEATRAKLLSLEKGISTEQSKVNDFKHEVQKFEERILVNSERIRSLEETTVRYGLEKDGFTKRLVKLKEQLESMQATYQKAETDLTAKKSEFESLNSLYQEERSAYEKKRTQAREIEANLLSITEELSLKQNEGERLKATNDGLSQRIKQLEEDDTKNKERWVSLEKRLSEAEEKEQNLLDDLDEKIELLDKKEKELDITKRSLESLQKADLQDQNRIDNLENQADLLKRLIENYEDYPSGVRYLASLKNDSFKSLGPLANLILVQQQYRPAIAAALGEAATYLVVEDKDSAYSGMGLLKQEKKGLVSFLPLKQVVFQSHKHPVVQDLGVVGWANELVRNEEKLKPIINGLLGSFLIVQDLQTAHRLFDTVKDQHINIVTLNGEVLGHWGLLRGGSQSKRQSDFVGRQEQLKTLLNEIEQLQQISEDRQEKIIDKETASEELKRELERLSKETKELEEKGALVKIEIGKLKFEEQTLTETREKHDIERKTLLEKMDLLGRNLEVQTFGTEDLQTKRRQLSEQSSLNTQELAKAEQQVNEFSTKVQAINVKVARLQSDYQSLKRESDSVKQQITETENLITFREKESNNAREEITELSEVNKAYTDQIAEIKKKLDIAQSQLDELEEQQYDANTQIADQEKQIRAARSKSDELSESVHQIQLRVSELKLRLENMQHRMLEEFEHDLKREPIDKDFNLEETHNRIEKFRGRMKSLGPVNLLALKEYEQEKERLDFLQAQKDDLLQAKKNLTDTINIINNTAKQQFLETFEQVQANFTKVFTTFFEGGRASIVLRDHNDPLESDIDIFATPGGKRLSSLQLMSGGEKSLTAISILFAIYLVKPSPFCIFDEVDAPLDDQNTKRFTKALKEFSDNTQFLVVTHNKLTMRASDQIYGVTMAEEGVSKLVSVKFDSETFDNITTDAEVTKN